MKTIKIKESTHKRLSQRGRKGQSFDDIIWECINVTEMSERIDSRKTMEDE